MKRKYYIGKFNIADWLSIYRIASVPFLLSFTLLSNRTVFSWLLFASFATDMLDGFLARKLKIQTERGAKLDSVGDFLTLICSITALIQFEWELIKTHRYLFLVMIAAYLLQHAIAIVRYGRTSSFHTYLAKAAFLLQGFFLVNLFFFGNNPLLLYLAIVSAIFSSLEEIAITLSLRHPQSNVKGLYWILKNKRKLGGSVVNEKIPLP